MDINLNIDFADLDLNQEIGKAYDEDGDLVGGKTLASAVVQKLVAHAMREDYHADLKHRVQTIRDEQIRAAVAPMIEEALTAPFRRTNGYGEPKGEPITLREAVVETVQRVMNEPADSYRNDRASKLDALIRKHVEAAFQAEIAEAVKAAKEAVVAQIGTSLSTVVTEAVRTGLKAKS